MSLPKLLIIDDEFDLAEIIAEYLVDSFASTVCSSPQEAKRLLESQKFDLILSDLEMPEINGFQIISIAKSLNPSVPVVILTGHSQFDPSSQKALAAGAKGILVKPLESPSKLEGFLSQFLTK